MDRKTECERKLMNSGEMAQFCVQILAAILVLGGVVHVCNPSEETLEQKVHRHAGQTI